MPPAHRVIPLALVAVVAVGWMSAAADETSTGDKLRILFSNRFTFTDDGTPLVTVEIMGGQQKVSLTAPGGLLVRPDGDGGAEIRTGETFSISLESAKPAVIKEWTVVERLGPDDDRRLEQTMQRWKQRGFAPRNFEIGTVFGVEGEVLDSREVLVAIDPVTSPGGQRRAQAIAAKYSIETTVHPEMVETPRGVIVAKSGATEIRNPSVIWFVAANPNATIEVADVVVGAGGSQLETRRENRRYFGGVYVTVGRDGKLTVVNAAPADKLLAGLVPAEIYPDAPPAALQAQAIAARTELLNKIGNRHLTDPFLLCSSQHCQVYAGAGHEHPKTTQAVLQTRGKLLVRDLGGLADARYSASCGGHSENNEWIWGGAADPSLRGHIDAAANTRLDKHFGDGVTEASVSAFVGRDDGQAYCSHTKWSKDRYRWDKTISTDELSKLVAASYPGVGRLTALEPLTRGVSGRIGSIRLRGDKGEAVASGDLHIRRLLGGLRSSLFVVSPVGSAAKPSAFAFKGAGFGHGVGMCQLGAIGMAESGAKVESILVHYYPGTRIRRLY